MMIVTFIVGVLHLVLSGAWIASVFFDKDRGMPVSWHQYAWAVFCFALGLYLMIACIGQAGGVK